MKRKIKNQFSVIIALAMLFVSFANLQPVTVNAASDVAISFELSTPAVQAYAAIPSMPGATIKVSGTDSGVVYTKSEYFVNQEISGAYWFDSNTAGNAFVINYLTNFNGGLGNGFGKITGTFALDAAGDIQSIVAVDIAGNAVPAVVSGSGSAQKITFMNPTNTAANIEYTTSGTAFEIIPTPSDAGVVFTDNRDGSIIPPYGANANFIRYRFPVPRATLSSNTINYSVSRNRFDTATGKFVVTRSSSSSSTNTYVFTPNGDEQSYTTSQPPGQYVANIELKPQLMDYEITFAVTAATKPVVSLTMNGNPVVSTDADGFEYTIPLVSVNTVVDYTVTCSDFRTVNGRLLLKTDGTVEDITPAVAKSMTVKHSFYAPSQVLTIEMMPSITARPLQAGAYAIDFSGIMEYVFKSEDRTRLFGNRITGGMLEIVNPDPTKKMVITGVTIEGYPTLTRNIFRTNGEIMQFLTGGGTYMHVRDVVSLANARFPAEHFTSYYDCLLFYMQTEKGYTTITTLEELDLAGLRTIFGTGPGGGFYHLLNPVGYDNADDGQWYFIKTQTGELCYLETDARVQQLGEKFLTENALFFTLDTTKTGVLPVSSSALAGGAYDGLRYTDYIDGTPANQTQVAAMVSGIEIAAGGSYIFRNISYSTIGDYLHNHFASNGLDFDFKLLFNVSWVGIDGVAFNDLDMNGTYDNADTLCAGVPVRLYQKDDTTTPVDQTITDAGGYYLFFNDTVLTADDYFVQVDLPNGKTTTLLGAVAGGENNVFTENADGITANSHLISYQPGSNVRANAGFKNAGKYTLTYDPNQGQGSAYVIPNIAGAYTVLSNGDSHLGYSRSGYTFAGWNTKADGTGTSYTTGSSFVISGDVTLYAQWAKNPAPKTGDNGGIVWFIALASLAAGSLLILYRKRKQAQRLLF